MPSVSKYQSLERIVRHFSTASLAEAERDLAVITTLLKARREIVPGKPKQAATAPATGQEASAAAPARQAAAPAAPRVRHRDRSKEKQRAKEKQQQQQAAGKGGNGNGDETVRGTTSAPPANPLPAQTASEEPDPAAEA